MQPFSRFVFCVAGAGVVIVMVVRMVKANSPKLFQTLNCWISAITSIDGENGRSVFNWKLQFKWLRNTKQIFHMFSACGFWIEWTGAGFRSELKLELWRITVCFVHRTSMWSMKFMGLDKILVYVSQSRCKPNAILFCLKC